MTSKLTSLAVLAMFAVLTAALVKPAMNFEVDASADTLLTEGDRNWLTTQSVYQRFSPDEFLLVAYEPSSGNVFSKQTQNDLRAIAEQIKTLPRVASVRSILNVPMLTLGEGLSLENPESLTLEKQNFTSAQMKAALTGHPIYEDLLVNQSQTATAIQVLFRPNAKLRSLNDQILAIDLEELKLNDNGKALSEAQQHKREELEALAEPLENALDEQRLEEISAVREMMAAYEARANLYLGGAHVVGHQLVDIINNDLVVFGSAIALCVALLLLMIFRRLRWVLITAICCVTSVLTTMGLLSLLGLKATVISSNFISIQLILTIAIVVHLIVQYREEYAKAPDADQSKLVTATMRSKLAPCLFAGVTTSVGFASLILSDIQPVISFGWMMMIAMAISLVVGLTLFPTLLIVVGKAEPRSQWAILQSVIDGMASACNRRPALITLSGLVIFTIAVAGSSRLDVENSFINYFKADTKIHQELTFIDQEFGGSTPLDLVYTIPAYDQKPDLVLTADAVQQSQRIQTLLAQEKGMGKILSVTNVTELARTLNDRVPLTEYELTAVYLSLEKAVRQDLLGAFLAPEEQQMRFSMRIKDSTEGLNRAQLLDNIKQDLADLQIPPESYTLSGLFVLYQAVLEKLYTSQILTLALVLCVLAIAFCLIFRSIKIGLVALAPNILATSVVLGSMGWLGIPLDLMTITIAAVAMGIAVDDTIHYVHRFVKEKQQADDDTVILRTHRSVGHAVLYTTLIIAFGFGLLMFSDFVPAIVFGLLTALAMVMALLADLLLLPVLLKKFA